MASPDKDMIRYEIRRQQLKRRRRLVGTFAGVVVLVAALALMVPALSMTRQAAVQDAGAVPTVATFQAAQLAPSPSSSAADAGEESVDADAQHAADSQGSNNESSGAAEPASSASADDAMASDVATQLFQWTIPDTRTGAAILVRVEAPEGAFPEGTTMTLGEIFDENVVNAAKRAAAEETAVVGNTHVAAVDIAFKDAQGNEVEPATQVRVQMAAQAGTPKEDMAVVHVADDMSAKVVQVESLALESAADRLASGRGDSAAPAEQDAGIDATTVSGSSSAETSFSATAITDIAPEVVFSATSFSVYALVYTVDFAYEANGHQYEYSIPGEGTVKLSELLVKLGIAQDVSQVESVFFSNDELVRVSKSGLFGLGSDWNLRSLQPFTTRETLTVTMQDGTQIYIDVTDAQGTPLAQLISDATLQIGGQTYGEGKTWTVYPDTDYQMTLTFTEVGERQFATGGSSMVMDMPEGLTLPDGQSGYFDIPAGLAGTITGNKYEVRGGKLYITFGDDPTGVLTRSSNAHFDITVTAQFKEGTTGINFNDRVTRNVDTATQADVSISKTGNFNSQTGKMEYTVAVTSLGHTKNINVTDAIGGNNLKYSGDAYVQVNGQTLEGVTATTQGNGFSLTIPELQNGQTAYVKYTADLAVTEEMAKNGYKLTSADANTVKVTPEGGNEHTDTYVYPHEIRYSNIAKTSTGTEIDSDGNTNITWTITVNDPPKNSIAGATISDQIGWNSKEAMTYAADSDGKLDLDIQVIDASGNVVRNDKDTKVAVGSAWEGSQQEKWSYTIPNTDTEAYKYVITYKTKVDTSKLSSSTNGVVSNEASNDRGGSTGGTGVVPGVGGGGTGGDGQSPIVAGKSASKVTQQYIDWDIVVFIPKGSDYTNGLTITDELPWHYGNAGAGVNGAMVDTIDTSFGKQGVKVEGLGAGEDYTVEPRTSNDLYLKDADGQTLERQIVDIQITGLGKTDSDRTLTVKVRTLNSDYWLWAGTKNSEFTRHTNNAIVDGAYVSGTGQPMLSTIEKKGSQVGRPGFIQGDDGSIYFRYDIQLTNVHDGDDGNVPVVITDTFDSEYLEFVPVGVSGAVNDANYQNVYIRGGENSYSNDSGAIPHVPSFTVNDNQLTITANAGDFFKKEDGTYYPYYHLYYYLKLKNDVKDKLTKAAIANGGTYKLANTAEWEGLTAQNDVDYTVPTVQKDGWFRDSVSGRANNRLFDFFVDVNPERYMLNSGENLTITDEHTNNLTVDYSTVRVYEVKEGVTTDQMKKLLQYTAKLVAGEQLQDWEQKAINDLAGKYEQAQGVTWDFSGNQGTFNNLKDATHYVIAYSALIIGSGEQGFSNEVSVNGFTSSKSGSRNFGGTSTAGADVFQIQLLKHEYGVTSNGLKGATFQLFVDDGNGAPIPLYYGDTIYTKGTFSEYPEEYKQFASFNAGKQNLVGQPITFTTNELGYLLVALNQTIHGAQLDENVHYYLKEVESPAGYKIDSSVEYWSFTLTKDPDSVSYGGYDANGSRQWIYFYYDDILKMSNTRISQNEYLDVNVNKTWLGENGQPLSDAEKENLKATVTLSQKVDDGEWQVVNTIKNKDGDELQGTQVLNKANSWFVDWGQLVRSDGTHTYSYKVEEEAVQGFISSVTSKETSDKEGNTTLTFSATNQEVPKNPPTYMPLQVKKTWLQEDGETPETGVEHGEVRFQLFRVVSRTPFATTPTAGGAPYYKEGAIASEYVYDTANGTYKIPSGQFSNGVKFKDLVTSEFVETDGWYFYSYYIKEVEVEGYDQSVTQSTENGTTTFTMVNTAKPSEKTTTLQVAKKWQFQNADGTTSAYSPTAADEVHFVLYQVSSNKPFADPTKVDSGGVRYNALDEWGGDHWARTKEAGTYEIGRNWNWNAREFKNLPSVSIGANGKATYYAYYVREVDLPSNVQGSCTITANDDGTYTATITNTKLPEQTSVEVSKKWTEGGKEISWPADTQVLVTLLRDGQVVQNADGTPKTVTLSNGTTSAKFEGLPKTNASGSDYAYTVKEQFQVKDEDGEYVDSTTVVGKAVKATITPTDGGYAITNDLQSPGSLKVTKTINNNQSQTVDESKISFIVTGPNGYNQTFTYADMQGSPKEKTLTGLSPGTYTVKETDANTGVSKTATYTVTQQGTEAIASQTGTTAQAQVKAGQTTEVSFTNTYSEYTGETTQFTLNKKWSGVPDADKKEVKFKLYRMEVENTEGDSGAPSGDLPIEVYGGQGWPPDGNIKINNVSASISEGGTATFTYARVNYAASYGNVKLRGNPQVFYYKNEQYTKGWVLIQNDDVVENDDWISATFTIPENQSATKVCIQIQADSGFESLLQQNGNAYFSGSGNSNSVVYPQRGAKTQSEIEVLGGTLVSDYGEIVLNNSNGWTTTVDNLPKTNADDSKAYEYYVVEEGGAAYGASYAHTSDTITVTNTEMPSFTNLTVAKNWQSKNGTDVTESVSDSAQFELWQVKTTKGLAAKPGVGDVVKIKVSDGLNGIPEGQGTVGKDIVIRYKVTCSDVANFKDELSRNNVRLFAGYSSLDNYQGYYWQDDYNPSIINEDGNTLIIEYVIPTYPNGLTFTPKSIELKSFSWANATSKELVGTPDLAGGAIEETETITESLYDTFTLSAGDWTKQYSNLPKASADESTTYEYYVKEVKVPAGWSVGYVPADASSADKSAQVSEGTVNVTNTIPGPSTVSVTAAKAWDDSFTNHPEVTFRLYRKAMAEGEPAPSPLPKTAADVLAAGYSFVVDNDIIPVKTLAAVTGKASTELSDDEKTVRWDGLPEFDDDGKKYDYLVIENPVSGYSQKMAADVLNSFAFVNTPETLDLTVSKSWVKNGEPDTSENLPNSITYKVIRTAYSDPSRSMPVGEVMTVTDLATKEGQTAGTLTKEKGWTQTLTGLPKFTIDANGAYVYYGYYIEEETGVLGEDYVTSYQVGDGQPVDVAQRAPIDMSKAEAEATIINGTYSVTVNVLKVDANTSAPLTGATFQLRKSTGTGQWVNVGLRTGDNGAFVVTNGSESQDLQVDASGRLTVEGLTNGTYQFVETQAPVGYLITNEAPITFTVSNGTLRPTSTSTARYESADQTFIVPNTPGDALPNTGGIGTTIFTVVGLVLVAGGIVLLVRRRR